MSSDTTVHCIQFIACTCQISEGAKWKILRCDKSSKQNKKEINEKEEILCWTRTHKKKKDNSVWRGFAIITIMLKTKRETAKTYILVLNVFKTKVKEGPDYIFSVWCLVNYHINWEKLSFPCVSQSTRCLLLPAQTWMQARFEQCKENS